MPETLNLDNNLAIKVMPEMHRYALLAIFALIKKQQVTDNLVDLLIRLTNKIIPYGIFLLNLDIRLAVNHPNFSEVA